MNPKGKIKDWLDDPVTMRKFHGHSTVIWFGLSFPICIFLTSSIPLLVFMSVYAIVISHFAAWQAVRVEQKQDELKLDS